MFVHFERQSGDKIFINPAHVWALMPNDEKKETLIKSAAGETVVVKGQIDDVAKQLNQFS